MSHPEQSGFFAAVAACNRPLIKGGRILEIGSYDVNGSVRTLFDESGEYIGVDLKEGPGVDVVSYGHEVDYADAHFDMTLSGECFEHDPYWRETFLNMVRMTRQDGLVVFTCASRGRVEHGTSRTDRMQSPGTQSKGLDYYGNLSERDFETKVRLDELFVEYRFWYMPTSLDLYFVGVRAGDSIKATRVGGQLPDDSKVVQLRSLMPFRSRIHRIPLRIMAVVVPKARFQSFALPYWSTFLRVSDKVHGRHA
jgi:SAM-dependent methyltransferase